MPSIGNSAKPNDTATEAWASTYNQAAELFEMPERGRITRLGGWFAGKNSNARVRLVVWDSVTLAVLGQSAQFTAVGRPWAAGNVDRYEADLITPVELDEGVEFYVGLSRHADDAHQFTGRTTGAHIDDTAGLFPGPLTGFDSGGHGFGDYSVGFYVDNYDAIAGAHTRRGGAFSDAQVAVRRTGAWPDADGLLVRRSGAWVDAD